MLGAAATGCRKYGQFGGITHLCNAYTKHEAFDCSSGFAMWTQISCTGDVDGSRIVMQSNLSSPKDQHLISNPSSKSYTRPEFFQLRKVRGHVQCALASLLLLLKRARRGTHMLYQRLRQLPLWASKPARRQCVHNPRCALQRQADVGGRAADKLQDLRCQHSSDLHAFHQKAVCAAGVMLLKHSDDRSAAKPQQWNEP